MPSLLYHVVPRSQGYKGGALGSFSPVHLSLAASSTEGLGGSDPEAVPLTPVLQSAQCPLAPKMGSVPLGIWLESQLPPQLGTKFLMEGNRTALCSLQTASVMLQAPLVWERQQQSTPPGFLFNSLGLGNPDPGPTQARTGLAVHLSIPHSACPPHTIRRSTLCLSTHLSTFPPTLHLYLSIYLPIYLSPTYPPYALLLAS